MQQCCTHFRRIIMPTMTTMSTNNNSDSSSSSNDDNNGNHGKTRRRLAPTLISAVAVVVFAAIVHGVLLEPEDDAQAIAQASSSFSSNVVLPLWILLDGIQALFGSIVGTKDESIFEYADDGLPLCNGCHCTPRWDEDPVTFRCPEEEPPPWQYSLETIESLAMQEALNPFSLNCSPYYEDTCDTNPSLEREKWASLAAVHNKNDTSSSSTVVCGLVFDDPHPELVHSWRRRRSKHRRHQEQLQLGSSNDYHQCPLSNYTMRTFASEEEAIQHNAVVTHLNACGACSTTKDLAAYMKYPDMVAEGRKCTNRVMLFGIPGGVSCYEALGFTTPCATVWAHNSQNTATVCRSTCARHLFSPPNLPNKACTLNDCLHCDEIKSGPTFQLFAGRTRRNSGLRTPILRQCEGLANLKHDSCPVDTVVPPEEEEEEEEDDALGGSISSTTTTMLLDEEVA